MGVVVGAESTEGLGGMKMGLDRFWFKKIIDWIG